RSRKRRSMPLATRSRPPCAAAASPRPGSEARAVCMASAAPERGEAARRGRGAAAAGLEGEVVVHGERVAERAIDAERGLPHHAYVTPGTHAVKLRHLRERIGQRAPQRGVAEDRPERAAPR